MRYPFPACARYFETSSPARAGPGKVGDLPVAQARMRAMPKSQGSAKIAVVISLDNYTTSILLGPRSGGEGQRTRSTVCREGKRGT